MRNIDGNNRLALAQEFQSHDLAPQIEALLREAHELGEA